ncbi:MAG: hypothetical protein ABL897_03045 [Hyphomicrobium sp.]
MAELTDKQWHTITKFASGLIAVMVVASMFTRNATPRSTTHVTPPASQKNVSTYNYDSDEALLNPPEDCRIYGMATDYEPEHLRSMSVRCNVIALWSSGGHMMRRYTRSDMNAIRAGANAALMGF